MSNKYNGWRLYQGLYEVFWKNGIAEQVSIDGIIFLSSYKNLKNFEKPGKAPPKKTSKKK
jgi:hypothetical protein